MGYELALRSSKYATNLAGITDEANTPGLELATDLARRLETLGYQPARVVNDGCLKLIWVSCESAEVSIVVHLFEPDEVAEKGLWIVYVPSGRSFWQRIFRQPESPAVLRLMAAVEEAVRLDPALRVVRRSGQWPPWSEVSGKV